MHSKDGHSQQDSFVAGTLPEDNVFQGQYQFLETIGAGGMGIIYKARQISIDRLVAIKVLKSDLDPDGWRRFQNEATAASKLSHRYIVTVHDLGTCSSGQPFIVMDYLDGMTLAQYLSEKGPLSTSAFIRFFRQICDALQHAHANNVLHRDLKPSNIMILRTERTEEVRLMDFGIAKLLDDTISGAQPLTKTGEAIGSPLYMSPEQCRGAKLDRRSDLYSLGCVMYESLAIAPPFIGASSLETMMMHTEQKPLPLGQASLGRQIEPGLEDIVLHLLEKDPARRYQSAKEVEADLAKLQDAVLDGNTLRFVYQSTENPGDKASIRSRVVRSAPIAGVILLLAASLGFLAWWLRPIPPSRVAFKDSLLSADLHQIRKFSLKDMIAFELKTKDSMLDLSNQMRTMEDLGQPFDQNDLQSLEDAPSTLTGLRLYGPSINDDGLRYLKDLRLVSLGLDHTDVKTLSWIKHMDSLKVLDVSYSRLDHSGMQVIGGLPELRYIRLEGTGINDTDLQCLYGLKNLNNLFLNDCTNLTRPAIERLKAALPKTEFQTDANPVIRATHEEEKLLYVALDYMAKHDWVQADGQCASVLLALHKNSIANNPLVAQLLLLRAKCQYELHNYGAEIKYCQQASESLADSPDSELQLANILIQEAQAYETERSGTKNQQMRTLAQQELNCREHASNLLKRIGSENDPLGWSNLQDLASDYELLGDHRRSVEVLDRLIAQCEQTKKTVEITPNFLYHVYIQRAHVMEAIAAAMMYQGEAKTRLRKACMDHESAWRVHQQKPSAFAKTDDPVQILYQLEELGSDYIQLKDYVAANRTYDTIIAEDGKLIRSGALKPQSLAYVYVQQANSYQNKSRLVTDDKVCKSLLRQAVAMRERAEKVYEGGPEEASMANIIQQCADYNSLSEHEKALAGLNLFARDYSKHGRYPLMLASGILTRGYTYVALHRDAEALNDFEAAAKLYRQHRVGAPRNWEVELLTISAAARNRLGQPDKAETLLLQAMKIPCPDMGWVKMQDEEMVKALTAQHKDAEAATFREKTAEAAKKLKEQLAN